MKVMNDMNNWYEQIWRLWCLQSCKLECAFVSIFVVGIDMEWIDTSVGKHERSLVRIVPHAEWDRAVQMSVDIACFCPIDGIHEMVEHLMKLFSNMVLTNPSFVSEILLNLSKYIGSLLLFNTAMDMQIGAATVSWWGNQNIPSFKGLGNIPFFGG